MAYDVASRRTDAEYELVDLLDTRCRTWTSPRRRPEPDYQHEHPKQWSEKVASFDGFVIVTPEYNHSTRINVGHRPQRSGAQLVRKLGFQLIGEKSDGQTVGCWIRPTPDAATVTSAVALLPGLPGAPTTP